MTDNYSYELTTSSFDEASAAPAVSVRLGNETSNGRQSSVGFSAYSNNNNNNNISSASEYYNYGGTSRNTDCNEDRPRSVIRETNYTTTTTTTAKATSSISDVISEITNNNTKDNCNYLSEIEQAILRSNVPVEINESEEITALGQKGIWANRSEVVNWRGLIPIEQYVYNEDPNPEIITKRTQQKIEYIQELAVRYLRPPTPPLPGEIVIKQECNSLTPPAPPLIIRQQPPRPSTPEPLVIREAPPQPPPQVNRRVITISGKRLPPPPRKVIIERLAPLPSKPQSAIIERWLPYSQVKRRVIYQRNCEQDPVACKPKNVIVQWEAPQVVVKKEVKYLGVIRANPAEYVQRFGSSLKLAKDLPQFVLDIKTPDGLVLAADYQYNNVHELEGDLQALKLVDLDREGLSEYRQQLQKIGVNYIGAEAAREFAANNSSLEVLSRLGNGGGGGNGLAQPSSYSVGFNNGNGGGGYNSGRGSVSTIADVFSQVDRDSNGRLSQDEARQLYVRLNSRLGRSQTDDDARQFVRNLASGSDGSISLSEFRRAFERLI